LESIGHPEKKFRASLLAANSELTHNLQTVSWGLCLAYRNDTQN